MATLHGPTMTFNNDKKTATKIGLSSRYFEPMRFLTSAVSSSRAFKQVYNSEKETYHMPYLYANYKTDIDPTAVSETIFNSVRQFFDDNLFTQQERKLLLTELRPQIEHFGADTIRSLTNRMDITENKEKHADTFAEYKKTIAALEEIRKILGNKFLENNFMAEETEPSVFISYSHDSDAHKDWVLQLATRLRNNGVNAVLDRWNLKLGSDVASFMERGLSKSNRVICVCSDKYVEKANGGKGGAGYEKQIMTAEYVKDQNTNWVVPLIKNNPTEKKTPTFLNGRMYISFEDANLYESKYEELLRDILDEPVLPVPAIGKNPFQNIKDFGQQKFIPSNEKYVSPAVSGTVTFDYSNNDGHFAIGQGELMFETMWTQSGNGSIHIYKDPPSINAVALVKDLANIKEIKDARAYDASSRARTVHAGQIAILQNKNGFYAAIKVHDVKADHDGKNKDEITFDYFIQTNGSPDFTS